MLVPPLADLARAGREAGSELQGRTPRLCLLFGVLNAAHRSYYLAFLPACLICPSSSKQATSMIFARILPLQLHAARDGR